MLIKTPKFEINDLVTVEYYKIKDSKLPSFTGKVVYIFKKFEIPSKKKLIKYYGTNILNPKYGILFGPMFEDRIVIKKDNEKKIYAIFPMAGYGRYFTIKLNIRESNL